MRFLVSVKIRSPLCLIITLVAAENTITMHGFHVILEIAPQCCLIITLIARILDSLMYRSVMSHHCVFVIENGVTIWTLT